MKLQGKGDLEIPILVMRAGEVGIITKSYNRDLPIGVLIQRFGNSLLILQSPIFMQIPREDNLRVRILQKGEILIIE